VLVSWLSATPAPGIGPETDSTVVDLDLLDHFAPLDDRRDQRWVEHPAAAVLTLCAAAVMAGMRSFTAIAGWVADTPATAAAPDVPAVRQTRADAVEDHDLADCLAGKIVAKYAWRFKAAYRLVNDCGSWSMASRNGVAPVSDRGDSYGCQGQL
jgi:hypothetical protein